MSTAINPPTMARPIGHYSQAIASSAPGTWLHVSGQVGILPDGVLADGIEAQAEAAWHNIAAVSSKRV